MASGDSPMLSPRRCRSDGSGSSQCRFSASRKAIAASSPPGSSATASASESCSPSSASCHRFRRRRVGPAARPKISGAASRPSTRCGVCVLTAGPYWAAGDTEVLIMSEASMVGDSSGSTTPGGSRVPAARAQRLGLAARRPAAAAPAAATPCANGPAHCRSDDPVASRTPATNSATTSTSTPMRPMTPCSSGPESFAGHTAVQRSCRCRGRDAPVARRRRRRTRRRPRPGRRPRRSAPMPQLSPRRGRRSSRATSM